MSAPNTKDSKIGRILKRQIEDSHKLDVLTEDSRLAVHQAETIKVLTVHCASLEDDNKRLRRYLGSVLFERRVKAANELLANSAAPQVADSTAFVTHWITHQAGAHPESDAALRDRLRQVVVGFDRDRTEEAIGSDLDAMAARYKLQRHPVSRPIPTLRIADTSIAAHTHSGALPHDIPPGEYRCRRCELLKAAIEATGEGCIETGAAA